jgi:uncharacterized protein (DUF2345 family)
VGNTSIIATSPITFAADTIQTSILAQAVESAPTDYDTITVDAGVTVRATTGNVVFEAGDRIRLAAGSIVRSLTAS